MPWSASACFIFVYCQFVFASRQFGSSSRWEFIFNCEMPRTKVQGRLQNSKQRQPRKAPRQPAAHIAATSGRHQDSQRRGEFMYAWKIRMQGISGMRHCVDIEACANVNVRWPYCAIEKTFKYVSTLKRRRDNAHTIVKSPDAARQQRNAASSARQEAPMCATSMSGGIRATCVSRSSSRLDI